MLSLQILIFCLAIIAVIVKTASQVSISALLPAVFVSKVSCTRDEHELAAAKNLHKLLVEVSVMLL